METAAMPAPAKIKDSRRVPHSGAATTSSNNKQRRQKIMRGEPVFMHAHSLRMMPLKIEAADGQLHGQACK